MARRGPGRPPKLTPAVQDTIVRVLRAGNFREAAALMAHIHEATFYRWLKLGEQEKDDRYVQFRKAVMQADAEGAMALLQMIQRAAKDGTCRAAAWFLERRWPEEWGRKGGRTRTG